MPISPTRPAADVLRQELRGRTLKAGTHQSEMAGPRLLLIRPATLSRKRGRLDS